jgi:hypothetical protein
LHVDAFEALSGEGVLAFRTESCHMAGIPQVFGREIRSDTDSGSTHFESGRYPDSFDILRFTFRHLSFPSTTSKDFRQSSHHASPPIPDTAQPPYLTRARAAASFPPTTPRQARPSSPRVVRWLVTDHEATVYPGSDAVVVNWPPNPESPRSASPLSWVARVVGGETSGLVNVFVDNDDYMVLVPGCSDIVES